MQLEFPVSTPANPLGDVPCESPILSGSGEGQHCEDLRSTRRVGCGTRVRIGPVGTLSTQRASVLVAACHTRRWWHSAIRGRVGRHKISSWASLVTRFILFMANGGGRRAGRTGPKWGRGRRLTQLRGIASGGCLDDSDWKSTIVPSMNAVSEAYRSFKNPTLSWAETSNSTHSSRARLANTAALPPPPPQPRTPSTASYADPRPTNRMTGSIARPAKPLLLVSASSSTHGSACQRLVDHTTPTPCAGAFGSRLFACFATLGVIWRQGTLRWTRYRMTCCHPFSETRMSSSLWMCALGPSQLSSCRPVT